VISSKKSLGDIRSASILMHRIQQEWKLSLQLAEMQMSCD